MLKGILSDGYLPCLELILNIGKLLNYFIPTGFLSVEILSDIHKKIYYF